MGYLLDLLRGNAPLPMPADPVQPAPMASRRFAIGDDWSTWNALVNGVTSGRVSRAQALGVPAVKRARDLICGTLGTLPLRALNMAEEEVPHQLLEQPESLHGLVKSVTLARTLEDLLLDGSSLWLVIQRDSTTHFPTCIERIDFAKWTQDSDTREIRVGGREIRSEDIVLFTSPNDALCVAGATAIRSLIRLEATASMYMDSPAPAEYFTASDGAEPDEDDITSFLAAWKTARQTRSTAFVPSSVTLEQVTQMTGEQMQLVQARNFGITEISRLTGIDPGWLAADVSSRTYSNLTDERRSWIDFTCAPFLHAVEERLSLNDVTPRGQRVRWNLDGFLRGNTPERYAAHAIGLTNGFLTISEVRDLENRPAFDDEPDDDTSIVDPIQVIEDVA